MMICNQNLLWHPCQHTCPPTPYFDKLSTGTQREELLTLDYSVGVAQSDADT